MWVVPQKISRVNLAGCTAIFCDIKCYPSHERMLALSRGGICVGIGVHPRAPTLPDDHMKAFIKTFSEPAVAALGEIGLDWTTNSNEWYEQEQQFIHLLGYAMSKEVVVVLHLRSTPTDPAGRQVYYRGLYLAREVINRNRSQIFHLHCFGGPADVVNKWLEYFPNTYFGYTNQVECFNHLQCEGLRAIPPERLLLETDAPYFAPNSFRRNAPHLLGFTALHIAGNRGEAYEEVLRVTTENTVRIYVGGVQM